MNFKGWFCFGSLWCCRGFWKTFYDALLICVGNSQDCFLDLSIAMHKLRTCHRKCPILLWSYGLWGKINDGGNVGFLKGLVAVTDLLIKEPLLSFWGSSEGQHCTCIQVCNCPYTSSRKSLTGTYNLQEVHGKTAAMHDVGHTLKWMGNCRMVLHSVS